MLKVTTNQVNDYIRPFKGNISYGLQIAPNDSPLQITGAYCDYTPLVYFYAVRLNQLGVIDTIYDLPLNLLLHEDGQFFIDPDNTGFGGNLPDGAYFFEFSDGINIWSSEIFGVSGAAFGNFDEVAIKHFESSEVFLFND